jgi:hypothetical protein
MLRPEFDELESWVRKNKLEMGKWFRVYLDKYEIGMPSNRRRWWACIEVKGRLAARPQRFETRVLQSEFVASVTFDPKVVSDRLVFHGLECWLDWRTRFGEYEEAGPTREVFIGDPWVDPAAKSMIELQVPIKKMEGGS